ncbi:MAG: peptidylprolyl isomerase [Bryobacteraceae bacterium]
MKTAAWHSIAARLARERIIYFLVAGVLLFAAGSAWPRATRKPDLSRDEALYRQALASGLQQDDAIIRRRLVQKIEFLFADPALTGVPSEKDLASYLRQHRDRYEEPGKMAFSQVYFSRSRRGSHAVDDARAFLAKLAAQRHPPEQSPPKGGDPFMLGYDFPAESREEIAAQFGDSFAAAINGLAPGLWQGPIESAFGAHLVRVSGRQEGRLPSLDEVRARVFADVMNERRKAAAERAYARIRSHYQVVVQQENQ